MKKNYLILGLAPTSKGSIEDDPGTCRSARKVRSWVLNRYTDPDYNAPYLLNYYDEPTSRPSQEGDVFMDARLSSFLDEHQDVYAIVALGKVAFAAARRVAGNLGYEVVYVPHPSGLNRVLNDKSWEEVMTYKVDFVENVNQT